jgi:hypothetical protein
MEMISSSENSVLTRATWRHATEDGILQIEIPSMHFLVLISEMRRQFVKIMLRAIPQAIDSWDSPELANRLLVGPNIW